MPTIRRHENFIWIKSAPSEWRTRLILSNTIVQWPTVIRSLVVCTLWLAERHVYMRVCKHGCDVKMFCFSRANHASTNLKKGFELKNSSTSILYLPFSLSAETKKIITNMLCKFFFAWADILSPFFEKHLFCKTKTDYMYKLHVQDLATCKNFSFNQCSKQERFAFFLGKAIS